MNNMGIELLREALSKGGKTAVMWVQEMCQKQGCALPRYDEKDLRPHVSAPPEFQVRATVIFNGLEYTASGVKTNKKEAKQEAAVQLLHNMRITPKDLAEMQGIKGRLPFGVVSRENEVPDAKFKMDIVPAALTPSKPDVVMTTPVVIPTQSKSSNIINASGQCCQDLIILCEKRGIPLPEYECVKEEGPPHLKIFGVECRVRPVNTEPIVVMQESNQKKKAKHMAAAAMLEKLQDVGTEGNLVDLAKIVASTTISSSELTAARIFCKDKLRCSELFSHAHHRYQKMIGPTMMELRKRDLTSIQQNSSEPTDILGSIAKDEDLELNYIPVPEKASNGLHQCYCEISYSGEAKGQTSVFIGEGINDVNAERAAAMNGLIFLKDVSTP